MDDARKPTTELDFDTWFKLTQSVPASFEEKRRKEIDDLVEKMRCRDDDLPG